MIEQFEIFNFLKYDKKELEKLISEEEKGSFDDYQYNNALKSLLELQKFLKNKNNVILYRLLQVDDISEINKDELGNHYTTTLDNMDDVTLFDIGIDVNKKIYSIEILVNIKNIDLTETIEANINYPFEQEIYIKNNDLIINNIKEWKKN